MYNVPERIIDALATLPVVGRPGSNWDGSLSTPLTSDMTGKTGTSEEVELLAPDRICGSAMARI